MTPRVAYRRLFARFGPQGWWPIAGRYRPGRYAAPAARDAFEICVGAVLTQNTAWANVEKALAALGHARALSPQALRAARPKRLQRWIRPSGYFAQKTKKLKVLAQWAGVWPRTLRRLRRTPLATLRAELLALWGVGPETADSILLYAGGRRVFVVDAYTRRIGSRVGWFAVETPYSAVQAFFSKKLPASPRVYNETHALFVRLAKEHCRATPDCGGCPLRSGCAAGRKA